MMGRKPISEETVRTYKKASGAIESYKKINGKWVYQKKDYKPKSRKILQTSGTKICTKCGIEKDIDQFHTMKSQYKRKTDEEITTYKYKRNECKKCCLKKGYKWREDNPDQVKSQRLNQKYGISLLEKANLFEEQNCSCAICGTAEPKGRHKTFHVDHCHKTGNIRGLLCHSCNTALGHFKDDPDIIHKAWIYLCLDQGRVDNT